MEAYRGKGGKDMVIWNLNILGKEVALLVTSATKKEGDTGSDCLGELIWKN